MKKFIVDAYKEYSQSYIVEANTDQEATKLVHDMFLAGEISQNNWQWGEIQFEVFYDPELSVQELVKAGYVDLRSRVLKG
jgi:hypothetical protein